LHIITDAHKDSITKIAVKKNQKEFVTASLDGSFKIWDLEKKECIDKMEKAHTTGIFAMTLASDDHLLITSSADRTINLWDLPSKECLHTFTNTHSFIYGDPPTRNPGGWVSTLVAIDNKHILSGCIYNSIKMWNIKRRRCIYHNTVTLNPGALMSNSGLFVISSKKNIFVSGHSDGSLRIFMFSFVSVN